MSTVTPFSRDGPQFYVLMIFYTVNGSYIRLVSFCPVLTRLLSFLFSLSDPMTCMLCLNRFAIVWSMPFDLEVLSAIGGVFRPCFGRFTRGVKTITLPGQGYDVPWRYFGHDRNEMRWFIPRDAFHNTMVEGERGNILLCISSFPGFSPTDMHFNACQHILFPHLWFRMVYSSHRALAGLLHSICIYSHARTWWY